MTRTVKRGNGEKFSEGLYALLKKREYISHFIGFRRKLARIMAKLGPLAEQRGLMRFFKNVDHANVLNGFVNELSYALTDYQVWDPNSVLEAV